MSPDELKELKWMAYLDGELDAKERAEVEAWLATDPDAMRIAKDVGHLGEMLKLGYEGSRAGKAAASFDIADAVMAKVAAEPAPSNVVPLKPRAASGRAKIGAGVAAALALAASVVLMTRGGKNEVPIAQQTAVTHEAPASGDVDVDVAADSPGHSVSVFYLPSESTQTTSVVVWVDESAGEAK